MKPKTIDLAIRLLGIPVGVLGLYIIAVSLQGFYQGMVNGFTPMDWKYVLLTLVFYLFLGSIVLALSSFAIYTAITLWGKITATRVRWLVAIYAFALWCLIMNVLKYTPIATDDSSRFINEGPIGSVLIIVCAIVYQIISRWLIARSSLGPEPLRFASRQWVRAFCFLIWIGLSGVIDQWSQVQPRSSGGPNSWVEGSIILGPMLFAWLLYKSIVYYQDRRYKRYKMILQQELASG